MSELVLETNKLHKVYDGSSATTVEVFKGINFRLARGEVYYILGHSGVGKSTFLHLLGGLDTPTSGDVLFDGKSLSSMNESQLAHFRNKNIGFVFQFYHLLPELTLLENVMLPLMISNESNAEEKAIEWIERVGLKERIQHLPSQLSGGEQQRTTIARALVHSPQVVLCDEPTGNLDETNAKIVYDLIESLNQEEGVTFCIVTHEESFVKSKPNVYRLTSGNLQKES